MNDSIDPVNDWNIVTNIGPISFNILLDSSFFNSNTIQSSERHRHGIFELHIINKGSGITYIDDTQYVVVPNSFYLVKEGVCHMQKGGTADPIRKYTFKFEFCVRSNMGGVYLEEEIKTFIYMLSNSRFFYSKNLDCIKNLISEIQTELTLKPAGYYTKTQHLFSLLFLTILREMAVEAKQLPEAAPVKINRENRIRIIENFFDKKHNGKVTSEDLCRLVHVSRSQLNRILKDRYKISFKKKYMETQLEYAKDLLLNTRLTIAAIAEKAGYSSENNFSAFFKRKTGISPKYYRQKAGII